MGFLTRLLSPSKHDNEIALKTLAEINTTVAAKLIGGYINPPARGTAELIDMYNRAPNLRMVVAKISDMVASTRWHVGYRKNKRTSKAIHFETIKRMPGEAREKAISKSLEDGEISEIDKHPLLDLLYNGNDYMDGYWIRHLSNTYMDIKGEGFWFLEYNDMSVLKALWPVPAHWVTSTPSSTRPWYSVTFGGREVGIDRMIWFKNIDPVNPYGRGTGMGEALGDELDTSEYAAMLIKAGFFNRGMPSGIAAFEGASEEQLKAVQAKMDNEFRGPQKFGRVHFAGGKMTYTKIQETFDELQVLPLRDNLRDIVIHSFGVPPEILGIVENSNRATIESAIDIMARFVLIPRLNRDLRIYERYLVPLFDDRLIIWYDNPIPEDTTRKDAAATLTPWALTQNEHRRRAGLEDIDGGDVHMVPLGMTPMVAPFERGAMVGLEANNVVAKCCDVEHKDDEISPEKLDVSTLTKAEEGAILGIVNSIRSDVLTEYAEPVQREHLKLWGDSVLRNLGVTGSFDLLNPRVALHLDLFSSNKIKGINETTKKQVRATLIEGVQLGEGNYELTKRVSNVFENAATWRARAIARTEVNGSASFGTYTSMVQSNVVDLKQWVASLVNTREEHLILNGQVKGINELFEVNGYSALYPGDFGVAEMDINCGCTVVAVIETPKTIDELAIVWKDDQAKQKPWKKDLEDAFVEGFKSQEESVMKIAERLLPV
jgi:phage portal protein BeeE